MNYGYDQGYQGVQAPQYNIPTPRMPYGQQGPSALQQYAQGLKRIEDLRSLGYNDDEIRKMGFDPKAESSSMSEYGGLLNARDKFKTDMANGAMKGIEYAGTKIGEGAVAAGEGVAKAAGWLGKSL
jgi:hypothetical protein